MKKVRMMVDAFVAANLEKCEGLAQLYGHAANKMLQNMEKRKLQKGDGENSAKSSASSASGPKPKKEEKVQKVSAVNLDDFWD